jgi:proteasome regulatory subunit
MYTKLPYSNLIDIPLPNEIGRNELFKINLKNIKLDEKVVFEYLVQHTEGYSGADISTVL